MRLLAAALLSLAASVTVHAQQPRDVEGAKRTIASIEELLKQRPNDGTLYFLLARFRSEAGDIKGAVAALEKASEVGDGFLPARDQFAVAWEDPAFKAVYAKMEAKLPRLDFAPNAFEIQDRTLIPEGIAYDAPSHAFFVGSVAHGLLHLAGYDHEISPVEAEAMEALETKALAICGIADPYGDRAS